MMKGREVMGAIVPYCFPCRIKNRIWQNLMWRLWVHRFASWQASVSPLKQQSYLDGGVRWTHPMSLLWDASLISSPQVSRLPWPGRTTYLVQQGTHIWCGWWGCWHHPLIWTLFLFCFLSFSLHLHSRPSFLPVVLFPVKGNGVTVPRRLLLELKHLGFNHLCLKWWCAWLS